MEWYMVLFLIFGGLIVIMFTGLPIAFSFFLLSSIVIFGLMGEFGLRQLILGMYDSLNSFPLTAIPFFMVMGEVFYQSGIVTKTLDSLSKFVRKIPGRLSIITLLGGGVFAALSGSVVANTAMFGSLMLPEMMKRGYSKQLTAGSIMASGALAMVIPPSAIAVLLGGIAGVSVGKILVGSILPGVLLVVFYISYVTITCLVNPSQAPSYEVEVASLRDIFKSVIIDIIPLIFVFLLVMGLIFFGVATPTEAAALGALGSFVLTLFYGRFSLKLVYNSLLNSLKVTAMILMIIAGSAGFSQILALTGTSREAVAVVLSLQVPPMIILLLMLGLVILLGFFMEQTAIMMITLPMFMPIVQALHFDQVWFAVLVLICLQIGQLTPPVGLALFTMKGVAPSDVTMSDIYKGAVPYVFLDIALLVLLILIPGFVTLLPNV
ncbi:TRAP transporter large permease [Paradesulfitobacterium ferrireducens]|uniref:TRAP transporter large permease n=1 Tax=Paradesulfitobacterium ferrireducens TaxID=2816476 RepID=UPI001A8FD648|nr:TRAP transporter large permease subunit [Paradesulfitobacterium ferrireducens]